MKIHLRFLGNGLLGQLVRAVIILVVIVVSSIVAFFAGIFSLHKDSTTRLKTIMSIVKWLSYVMHDFMIGKIIFKGEENLRQAKRPVIFVSNHESYWDAITMPVILQPTVFTIKRYVLFIPFAGWTISLTPVIKVDGGIFGWKRKNKQIVLEKSKNELKKGNSLFFYSQGTRVRDGSRPPFKKGAARLSLETNIPIIPIAVNSIKIWSGVLLTKTGDVTISFGKPVYPEGKTVEELTEELEKWVYEERSTLD
ncbi:lysophospholipid acyltransferase family protein [Candidatus Ichthyocystis hellenicum]|uniref:lysophospholipid acyltransferase family protein n=1 Tax=Candidatus Ichthyocystis hellenicum TaxID=1561003 RepID=UPI000B855FFA|nr:lysophospholipid acyltransferase family protein [Candidatus Ichthyocystis hellenicum]